jgi:hypothetical protein
VEIAKERVVLMPGAASKGYGRRQGEHALTAVDSSPGRRNGGRDKFQTTGTRIQARRFIIFASSRAEALENMDYRHSIASEFLDRQKPNGCMEEACRGVLFGQGSNSLLDAFTSALTRLQDGDPVLITSRIPPFSKASAPVESIADKEDLPY